MWLCLVCNWWSIDYLQITININFHNEMYIDGDTVVYFLDLCSFCPSRCLSSLSFSFFVYIAHCPGFGRRRLQLILIIHSLTVITICWASDYNLYDYIAMWQMKQKNHWLGHGCNLQLSPRLATCQIDWPKFSAFIINHLVVLQSQLFSAVNTIKNNPNGLLSRRTHTPKIKGAQR